MLCPERELPEQMRGTLEQVVAAIVGVARPSLVILFGSWAEGRAGEDSDLDLLVVASTNERMRLARRLRAAIKPLLGARELDLIVIPEEGWEKARRLRGMIGYEADRYGVKLYERAA